ncbi:hypothetical protein Q4S41_06920 [Hymenobacter sp. CA1UV-4]|nr:hypothetical protein [Hymenobacter sp. CA1UV-4]
MPIVTERKLELEFPSDWEVIQYDRQGNSKTGEPASFYRRIIERGGVQQVRGMDIVCRLPDVPAKLQFIEVKDDRKRTIGTGDRHAELFISVLQKTVGTLAGLVLAERLGEASLLPQACLSKSPPIEVVLFLVEPAPLPVATTENGLSRLVKKERVAALDQRLTAKLDEWGILFALYNLSNRPPRNWQVRDLV